jgi:MFS family permease
MTAMRLPPGALASRNFRLLLGCDVITGTGAAFAFIAIPFAVLSIGGSTADVGYVSAAAMAAMIAFLLVGGVVADRLARHKVMTAANAVQCGAQAVAAALVLSGHAQVWELLVLGAVRGLGLGFYFPAAQGLLPQTVTAEHRAQANAIDRVGRNSAQIGGAALGGLLVSLAGPGWGLAVDAACFAVAASLRAGMRFPVGTAQAGTQDSMIRQFREGWHEFLARRWLWVIVAEFAFLSAVTVAVTSVLGPVVARQQLGGAGSWGVILAAYGAGAVLGGGLMIRYRPQRMLLVASIAAGAISLLLFALAVPLAVPLIAAVALITGICAEVFVVNWVTTMQQEIPHELLSRLSAFDAMGSFALAPLGVALAGPIAAAAGLPATLAGGGLVIVLLTIIVLLVPEVRQLRRAPASQPVSGEPTRPPEPAAATATPAPAESG